MKYDFAMAEPIIPPPIIAISYFIRPPWLRLKQFLIPTFSMETSYPHCKVLLRLKQPGRGIFGNDNIKRVGRDINFYGGGADSLAIDMDG